MLFCLYTERKNFYAGGISMDGILDGKTGMTIDELIALLGKGQITATYWGAPKS